MNRLLLWLQMIKLWVVTSTRARLSTSGVGTTVEAIGFLIVAVILVLVAVIFASGSGTQWMNGIFGHVTSIGVS